MHQEQSKANWTTNEPWIMILGALASPLSGVHDGTTARPSKKGCMIWTDERVCHEPLPRLVREAQTSEFRRGAATDGAPTRHPAHNSSWGAGPARPSSAPAWINAAPRKRCRVAGAKRVAASDKPRASSSDDGADAAVQYVPPHLLHRSLVSEHHDPAALHIVVPKEAQPPW